MNEIQIDDQEIKPKNNKFNQNVFQNRIINELQNKSTNENDIYLQNNYEEKKIDSEENHNNNVSYNDENESMEEDTEREAVEFIQLQHQKIKKLKKELSEKNEIINNYKEKFNKINYRKKDEKENYILTKNLRQQIEILNKEKEELKLELYSKEKTIKELKSDLNDLTKKFNKYNINIHSEKNENSEKIEQMIQIIKEYSMQLKNKDEKNKIYQNEINKLNQSLTSEIKEKQRIKILYENKINEDEIWIEQINEDIKQISNWIFNYLGVFFDEKIEIQEIPKFTPYINSENINNYNKINLNLLRQTITEARNKIYDKQNKYENIIKIDKKEQIDLINKIENLNKNLNNLSNENIYLKEELNNKKREIEDMNIKFNNLMF